MTDLIRRTLSFYPFFDEFVNFFSVNYTEDKNTVRDFPENKLPFF